jgi:hypothetical protein
VNDKTAYLEWLRLANDLSLTEAARGQYRDKLAAYTHQQLREAFRFAASTTAPPSSNE